MFRQDRCFSVRPRESGDPEPQGSDVPLWMPAFAGTNGVWVKFIGKCC